MLCVSFVKKQNKQDYGAENLSMILARFAYFSSVKKINKMQTISECEKGNCYRISDVNVKFKIKRSAEKSMDKSLREGTT